MYVCMYVLYACFVLYCIVCMYVCMYVCMRSDTLGVFVRTIVLDIGIEMYVCMYGRVYVCYVCM